MQNLDGWIVGAEGHHHICKAPQKTWINYERAHQVCVIVLHIKILGQFRVRASNAKDTINQWGLPPPPLFFSQPFFFLYFFVFFFSSPPLPLSFTLSFSFFYQRFLYLYVFGLAIHLRPLPLSLNLHFQKQCYVPEIHLIDFKTLVLIKKKV